MPLTAADVMTREVITVTPSTPISEFARLCADDQISGAPVVTVDGRLVGVVSKTDLIPRLLEGNLHRTAQFGVRALFSVDDDDDDEYGSMAPSDDGGEEDLGAVDEIMQAELVTVGPGDRIPSIALKMSKERIHRVLVVQKGRLLGIITSLDLLGQFPAAVRRAKRKALEAPPRKPAAKRKPAPGKKPAKKKAKRR